MRVTWYRDYNGDRYQEMVSRSYNALQLLRAEYDKRGQKTWIDIFNPCEGQWALTVRVEKAA